MKTKEEASKKACELLRKHFIGLNHLNIIHADNGIGPYDDDYMIRNYPDEWSWFMQGWQETINDKSAINFVR